MDENVVQKKGMMDKIRSNPWMPATIVLAAILLVFGIVGFGKAEITGNAVSESQIGQDVVDYLNAQVGGSGVTLKSVEKESGLYKLTVSYQGSDIPVYATIDGKNIVSDVIPLDGSAPIGGSAAPVGPVDIDVGDAPSIGKENAPVTVVEFADFSCPFCAAASGDNAELVSYMKQRSPSWEPIVINLMRDYVETGKVRFVSKYSYGHSGGHPAQLVGWCLNEQDKFWDFYPKAYENQDDVEDLVKMKELARTISGVNMNALQTCLDSKKYDSRFDQEQAEGQAAGVQGTPAFFVNGKLISGAVPYSQMKAAIEAELANS